MLYKQGFTLITTCNAEVGDEDVDFFMQDQKKRREAMVQQGKTPSWQLSTREQAIAILLRQHADDFFHDNAGEQGSQTESVITKE